MLDRLSRRQFFRIAAGAAVAAVAAPEMVRAEGRKFWQLDRTMVVPSDPRFPRRVWIGDYAREEDDFDRLIRERMMAMKLDLERCIIFGEQPTIEVLGSAIVDEGVYHNSPPEYVITNRRGFSMGSDGEIHRFDERMSTTDEGAHYNNFLTKLSGVGANPFYVEAVNRVAEGQRNELEGLRGHTERGVLRRTSPDGQPHARRSRRDLFDRDGLLALVSGNGLSRDEAGDRFDG